MQGLVFDEQGLRYADDIPRPEPQAGEALIRIIYAGLCNTDLEIVRGYKGFHGILGHEFVGVVEAGPEAGYIGKRVAGDINIGCGCCECCVSGHRHHCVSRKVLGISGKNGAFADYIILPGQNLQIVPEKVSDLTAVFAEPLAAALEIVEQCHVRPSDNVAVIGDGKLGQLIAQVLTLTGCRLTVIGKHPEKLAILKEKAQTILYGQAEPRRTYDLVVECTGNETGLKYAGQIVLPRGKVILKSTFSSQNGMIGADWVVNELTLTGSRCGPIDGALRLMERGLVDVEPLIGGVYELAAWEKAFAEDNGIKVLFKLQ